MKKITLLALLTINSFALANGSGNLGSSTNVIIRAFDDEKGTGGDHEINAGATEYIILFNPVDGTLRPIGDTVPDFIIHSSSGGPGGAVAIRVRGYGG